MASVQKISPFLWFDGHVEEAAKFYVSVFPNSKITSINPMSSTIWLRHRVHDAQWRPEFKFNEACRSS